jgi:hypothetical protein
MKVTSLKRSITYEVYSERKEPLTITHFKLRFFMQKKIAISGTAEAIGLPDIIIFQVLEHVLCVS